MGAFVDMRERIVRLRERGIEPAFVEVDHEEYWRLWRAFKESGHLTGGANYAEMPEHPGKFDTVLFEGVRIVCTG